MAYDEQLARRVRELISNQPGMVEKRMFGGVGYLLNGNMACGVNGKELIVRLDPADAERALAEPYVHIFDMTGRPMKGWITVDSGGVSDTPALEKWVKRSLAYAARLPAK